MVVSCDMVVVVSLLGVALLVVVLVTLQLAAVPLLAGLGFVVECSSWAW